jgi:threonine dehydrogenase-like Zn-dependent dehydrogenase
VSDGARVVVNPLVYCGHCDSCRRGAVNVCRNRVLLGIQRSGGFAEYVSVPSRNCYALPEGTPLEAAALVEPLANAVHALRLVQETTKEIQRVGVIGSGMVGVAVTVVAKAAGIGHVEVVDLSPERTAVALTAGADAIGERLDGEFDVVFDAVGTGGTRAAAVDAIRPDGTAVFIGLHSDDPGFRGRDIIRNEKRVIGSFCYTDADFAAAVGLVSRVRREWYEVRPLAEGVDAFTRLLSTVPTTIKTVLVPGRAA